MDDELNSAAALLRALEGKGPSPRSADPLGGNMFGQAASEQEVEQELDDVAARLSADLRAKRPDLFDAAGRPKQGALERVIREHAGKKRLSRAEIRDLLRKPSS